MKIRRGYLLIEILMAISLLSVFAMVGVKLVTSSQTIAHTSAAAHNALSRQERMVDQMRRDVWPTDAIVVKSDGTEVELRQPEGNAIIWRIGVETGMQRVVTQAHGQPHVEPWNEVGPITFKVQGPVLVIQQPREELPPSERRLPSQMLMLTEGRP